MEQKEIRLNATKRKSLTNDYRRHCETQHSHEKEDFFDSREKATEAIDSSFATMNSFSSYGIQSSFCSTTLSVVSLLE